MARAPQPTFRRSLLAATLLILVGLVLVLKIGVESGTAQGIAARLISHALSSPTSKVSIGDIEGLLSSDITIRSITVADEQGAWLAIDRAHIVWRPSQLLLLRLTIDTLEVDRMTVSRKPVSDRKAATAAEPFRLPTPPVEVTISRLALTSATLDAPVLGQAAMIAAVGSAHLDRARGLGLVLDVERRDRPGTLAAKLDFAPASQRLGLGLHLDEAAGGLLAEVTDLPGRPPVRLALDGDGTLDDFSSRLDFAAGSEIAAEGTLAVRQNGTARKLTLDLAARASALLPATFAPIFADTTKLRGTLAFADDGSIAVPSVVLVGAAARLEASGRITADKVAELTITGVNIADGTKGTVLPGAAIQRLALDARLQGSLDAPAIDGALTVDAARLPSLSLARLSAKLTAVPRGEGPAGSRVLDLTAEAEATGLDVGDAALAEAIGKTARFTLRGSGELAGPIDIAGARFQSTNLSADFAGRVGSDRLDGQLTAEAPDLSGFSSLAKLSLRGAARLAARVEGAPAVGRVTATIDATARDLATGIAPIDGLAEGEARLTGSVSHGPDDMFRADDLRLVGRHATAQIDGAAGPNTADITALLTIPALEKADPRLTGRGEMGAHVTGSLAQLDATAHARMSDGTLLGRAVPDFGIEARITDLLGSFAGEARLVGTIGGKPAAGNLRVARAPSGDIELAPLDLQLGSVVLAGSLGLDPAYLVAGKLSAHARDLDDLSPLVLQKLAGTLDADLNFTRSGSRQDLAIEGRGATISGFGSGVEKLSVALTGTDLYRHPAVSGSVDATGIKVGGEAIERLRLDATEVPGASDFTLTALARGIDVEARGRMVPADPVRIDLAKLDARRGRTRIRLGRPASFLIAADGVAIENLVVATSGGKLSIDGRAGQASDLKVSATAVPLSVVDLVAPDLGLGGTIDADAAVSGKLGALSGTYKVRLAKVVSAQTTAAGLPPVSVDAKGRLDGKRTELDATISAGDAGRLTLAGTSPLAVDGPLDLALKGRIDLGIAGRKLAAAGRRVSGSVAIDGRATGTLGRPTASGSAALTNGTYQDAVSGTRFDSIRASLVAREDRIMIENASATARNGGTVGASGEFRLDPAAGFPGTVKIVGRRAEIARTSLATAIVDLDLALNGPLARFPRLSGKVGIETLDISIAGQISDSAQPLPGTRHIRPTPTAKLRLDLEADRRSGKATVPFDAALDVVVDVPGRIEVTGRGLDVQLGGSLKLAGTLAEPQPVGAFHLVQGRMQVLTSQLDIARANLTFAGDLSPQLDVLGTTQAGGASIRVAVTGSPSAPQFSFGSSPDYPQDEVISRLLFGQGSGRLTPTQALALAQAVAIYTGGSSALENLRRSLGLGDASRSRDPLTNWLGDRVSLGIRTGATPAQTGIGVDVSLWKQLKARGMIDARGAASVGVGAEYEW
jgi:translocation and assembly module TamB